MTPIERQELLLKRLREAPDLATKEAILSLLETSRASSQPETSQEGPLQGPEGWRGAPWKLPEKQPEPQPELAGEKKRSDQWLERQLRSAASTLPGKEPPPPLPLEEKDALEAEYQQKYGDLSREPKPITWSNALPAAAVGAQSAFLGTPILARKGLEAGIGAVRGALDPSKTIPEAVREEWERGNRGYQYLSEKAGELAVPAQLIGGAVGGYPAQKIVGMAASAAPSYAVRGAAGALGRAAGDVAAGAGMAGLYGANMSMAAANPTFEEMEQQAGESAKVGMVLSPLATLARVAGRRVTDPGTRRGSMYRHIAAGEVPEPLPVKTEVPAEGPFVMKEQPGVAEALVPKVRAVGEYMRAKGEPLPVPASDREILETFTPESRVLISELKAAAEQQRPKTKEEAYTAVRPFAQESAQKLSAFHENMEGDYAASIKPHQKNLLPFEAVKSADMTLEDIYPSPLSKDDLAHNASIKKGVEDALQQMKKHQPLQVQERVRQQLEQEAAAKMIPERKPDIRFSPAAHELLGGVKEILNSDHLRSVASLEQLNHDIKAQVAAAKKGIAAKGFSSPLHGGQELDLLTKLQGELQTTVDYVAPDVRTARELFEQRMNVKRKIEKSLRLPGEEQKEIELDLPGRTNRLANMAITATEASPAGAEARYNFEQMPVGNEPPFMLHRIQEHAAELTKGGPLWDQLKSAADGLGVKVGKQPYTVDEVKGVVKKLYDAAIQKKGFEGAAAVDEVIDYAKAMGFPEEYFTGQEGLFGRIRKMTVEREAPIEALKADAKVLGFEGDPATWDNATNTAELSKRLLKVVMGRDKGEGAQLYQAMKSLAEKDPGLAKVYNRALEATELQVASNLTKFSATFRMGSTSPEKVGGIVSSPTIADWAYKMIALMKRYNAKAGKPHPGVPISQWWAKKSAAEREEEKKKAKKKLPSWMGGE